MTEFREYIEARKNIWAFMNLWMMKVINRRKPSIAGFFAFLTALLFYPIVLIPSELVRGFVYIALFRMADAIKFWERITGKIMSAVTVKEFRINENEDDEEF